MRFANNFHSWLRHSWKLLANRLTRNPKIVIHGNSCIILYITIVFHYDSLALSDHCSLGLGLESQAPENVNWSLRNFTGGPRGYPKILECVLGNLLKPVKFCYGPSKIYKWKALYSCLEVSIESPVFVTMCYTIQENEMAGYLGVINLLLTPGKWCSNFKNAITDWYIENFLDKGSHKNIERHTTHTIVSWPNPKQWVIVHTC